MILTPPRMFASNFEPAISIVEFAFTDSGRPRYGIQAAPWMLRPTTPLPGLFLKNFANFWRARSRLYRNEILQENMPLTAFFKNEPLQPPCLRPPLPPPWVETALVTDEIGISNFDCIEPSYNLNPIFSIVPDEAKPRSTSTVEVKFGSLVPRPTSFHHVPRRGTVVVEPTSIFI